jgi:outer membrane lipoprotein-sorting protein
MPHFQGVVSRSYPCFRFRNSFLRRSTLLLTLMTLLMGSRMAQAQDGRSILLKTLHYYHSLHSYSGRANVDTLMYSESGQTVKHIGSSSILEMQRPNKLYIFLQSPDGSRSIYSDGTTFNVYETSPDQYITVPLKGKQIDFLHLLRVHSNVVASFDSLYFLLQASLPQELTDIRLKGPSTCNGHPVYVVTGTTTVTRNGKALLPAYWTWWIDRRSSLLYRVETTTPNIVQEVVLGTEQKPVLKNVKGTLLVRYTVTELKPDVNLASSDFVFTPPKTASRRRTIQELLKSLNQK